MKTRRSRIREKMNGTTEIPAAAPTASPTETSSSPSTFQSFSPTSSNPPSIFTSESLTLGLFKQLIMSNLYLMGDLVSLGSSLSFLQEQCKRFADTMDLTFQSNNNIKPAEMREMMVQLASGQAKECKFSFGHYPLLINFFKQSNRLTEEEFEALNVFSSKKVKPFDTKAATAYSDELIGLLKRILKLDESSNFFALCESESFCEILQNVLQVNLFSRVEKTKTTSISTSTSDLQQVEVNDAASQAVVESTNAKTQTSITTKFVKVISKDSGKSNTASSSQNDEFLKTLPLKSAVEMEFNSLFSNINKSRSKAIKDYSQKASTSTFAPSTCTNTFQKIKEELKNSFTPILREPSIQCPFCVPEEEDDDSFPSPQKFTKTRAYMSHYIAKHAKVNEDTGKPIFWCSLCDKVFSSRDCFVAHVKESICFNGNEKAVRRFQCPHCLNTFKRATHLYDHVMSVHKRLVNNEAEEEEVISVVSDEEDNEQDYHQRPSTSKSSASKTASRRPKITSFSDSSSSSSDVVLSPLKGERKKRTSNTKSVPSLTKKHRRLSISDLGYSDDALESLMNVETSLDFQSSSASPASESPQTPVELSSNAGSSTIEIHDEEVNKEKADEDFTIDFKEEFDEEIEIVDSPSNSPSNQPSQETSTSTSTQLKKKPNRYNVKFIHTSTDSQEQTENIVDGTVVDVLAGKKRSLPSKKKKASKKD